MWMYLDRVSCLLIILTLLWHHPSYAMQCSQLGIHIGIEIQLGNIELTVLGLTVNRLSSLSQSQFTSFLLNIRFLKSYSHLFTHSVSSFTLYFNISIKIFNLHFESNEFWDFFFNFHLKSIRYRFKNSKFQPIIG